MSILLLPSATPPAVTFLFLTLSPPGPLFLTLPGTPLGSMFLTAWLHLEKKGRAPFMVFRKVPGYLLLLTFHGSELSARSPSNQETTTPTLDILIPVLKNTPM